VLLFFIFKYTSVVVENYVIEGIQEVVAFFKMSDSLSAVTLLAFANGSGDVITALVASGETGGVSYSIGAVYGAGLFAFTLVVALCIF
jgi:Ca2+/Na+ antiporter